MVTENQIPILTKQININMRTIEEIIYSEKDKLPLQGTKSCGWNEGDVKKHIKEYSLEIINEISKNINNKFKISNTESYIYLNYFNSILQELKNKINE